MIYASQRQKETDLSNARRSRDDAWSSLESAENRLRQEKEEAKEKKLASTVGAAALGAILLGPVGAAIGGAAFGGAAGFVISSAALEDDI